MDMAMRAATATVQYYDAGWGGWRALDTFQDAPTAVFPLRKAHSEAKSLSTLRAGELRVVEAPAEGRAERITRYRGGKRLG